MSDGTVRLCPEMTFCEIGGNPKTRIYRTSLKAINRNRVGKLHNIAEKVLSALLKTIFTVIIFTSQALEYTYQALQCKSQALQHISQGLGYNFYGAGNTF